MVGSWAALDGLTLMVQPSVRALVEAFWPGDLTLVIEHAPSLAWDLGDDRGTVSIRMPLHPVALELLARSRPAGGLGRQPDRPPGPADRRRRPGAARLRGLRLPGRGPCIDPGRPRSSTSAVPSRSCCGRARSTLPQLQEVVPELVVAGPARGRRNLGRWATPRTSCASAPRTSAAQAAELLLRSGLRARLGAAAAATAVWWTAPAPGPRPAGRSSAGTASALRRAGVDAAEVAAARSTRLTREAVAGADLVIASTAEHVRAVWRLQAAPPGTARSPSASSSAWPRASAATTCRPGPPAPGCGPWSAARAHCGSNATSPAART